MIQNHPKYILVLRLTSITFVFRSVKTVLMNTTKITVTSKRITEPSMKDQGQNYSQLELGETVMRNACKLLYTPTISLIYNPPFNEYFKGTRYGLPCCFLCETSIQLNVLDFQWSHCKYTPRVFWPHMNHFFTWFLRRYHKFHATWLKPLYDRSWTDLMIRISYHFLYLARLTGSGIP